MTEKIPPQIFLLSPYKEIYIFLKELNPSPIKLFKSETTSFHYFSQGFKVLVKHPTVHCTVMEGKHSMGIPSLVLILVLLSTHIEWFPVGWILKFCSIFNRPGVAGAVIQSPPLLTDWFIDLFSHPFSPNLQTIITTKPLELAS